MIKPTTHEQILMVGTGYVGLVTAIGLAKMGNTISCYDINPERIANMRQGIAPFYEPQVPELLREGIDNGNLSFYDSLEEAYNGQRFIFVSVQTPQDASGKSDLSALRSAVSSIAETITGPTLLIIKSTVPVGIFDELEKLPEVQGKGITFVSCPEFLAEGTAIRDFFNPSRTVVGSENSEASEAVAGLFYGLGGKNIITNAKTAQMIKYSANSFLATRVAFINDIAEVCEKLDVNVHDVTKALVMDPRVGGTYLSPSIGFAGPCLPKDTAALIESSERVGAPTLLLRGVLAQNEEHLRHTIDAIVQGIGPKSIVAMFGLSFKPNTDDVRNSFALKIAQYLLDQGYTVRATDPQAIPAAKREIEHENLSFHDSVVEAGQGSDLQLFMTDWDEYKQFDFKALSQVVAIKNIFDGKKVLDGTEARGSGFIYRAVGEPDVADNIAIFEITDNSTEFTKA